MLQLPAAQCLADWFPNPAAGNKAPGHQEGVLAAVPADAASPLTIDVRQFVAAWGRDSYLAMELGKIRPVASHHRQIQGEEVLVMEFAGTLRRQEA